MRSSRTRLAGAARPWRVPFQRAKYGRELLVDASFLSDLRAFEPTARPHTLTFYDILLVTRGRGTYQLDDRTYTVAPGTVFFTQPGQIRRWETSNLDGACLFFARDFVSETFRDARFLEQFPFFCAGSREAAIRLTPGERQAFLGAFSTISSEIRTLRGDAPDLIRARLYELLVLLNRWYRARHPADASSDVHPTIARFRALVERQFTRRHRVNEYALELGLTPGHLNALCRWHLGQSAGALIRQRLALEAKRMLIYGDIPAFAVARELGFRDPAYFSRFFRREVGAAPRRFRHDRRHPEGPAPA